MCITNLINIFIEFITLPFIISIIGVFSFIASIVALIVAGRTHRLQKKSDQDLQQIDNSIDELETNITAVSNTTSKMESNVKSISEISSKTQSNVNKTYFQIERSVALNKYPETKQFEKINNAYRGFVFSLFDEEKTNILITISQTQRLHYRAEIVKNDVGLPEIKKSLSFSFYIIRIISPAYAEVSTSEQLKQYEKSPIKEGEYYGCKFDESAKLEKRLSEKEQGSWVLGQQLSLGQENEGFYQFCPAGGLIDLADTSSANEIMGCNQNNFPGNVYKLIDKFIMDENSFKLFQYENQIFFTIDNSPLKEIYILENLDQNKQFLIFDNLRGHIKSDNLVENLKNKILKNKNIKMANLPIKPIHGFEDEYKHLVRVPLNELD